jgi:uncharacterized protein YjbI with pentapeptide repeats
MSDEKQLNLLQQGVKVWNSWRAAHPEVEQPDLSGANLADANLARANLAGANLHWTYLRRANLSGANLCKADLRSTDLFRANLREANLTDARLRETKLRQAHLEGACLLGANLLRANLSEAHLERGDLREASFRQANLSEAHLDGARLEGAELTSASLVETNLEQANLTGSHVYGIAAWNPKLKGAKQSNLVITSGNEPAITVDDLEVAQFVYLLLTNPKLREVIDTVTTKVVLILGRFASERLAVLEAVRSALRQHDYVPILFDFEGPENQNVRATVETVARLARFVVVDLTDVKAVNQELQAIVPQIKVPVRPLLLEGTEPPGAVLQTLWHDYADRLLRIHRYHDLDGLLVSFKEKVIDPAETKAKELKLRELEDIFE